MSYGIKVAEKDIDRKPSFWTARPRLQIALNKTPAHIDSGKVKATAIVANAGNNFIAKETLYTIPHRLSYTPKPLVYFYVPVNTSYAMGKYFYAFGAVDDYFGYEVDDTNFKIVHVLQDNLLLGATSTANTIGEIRFKYMICSNPLKAITNPAART
mgnify:CR=1 FL=1